VAGVLSVALAEEMDGHFPPGFHLQQRPASVRRMPAPTPAHARCRARRSPGTGGSVRARQRWPALPPSSSLLLGGLFHARQ